MNQKRVFTWGVVFVLVLMAVLVSVQVVAAQARAEPTQGEIFSNAPNMQSASYGLYWDVLANSSGTMASTGYFLRSTLGQNAIGTSASASYSLHAGFWQLFYNYLYLPMIVR